MGLRNGFRPVFFAPADAIFDDLPSSNSQNVLFIAAQKTTGFDRGQSQSATPLRLFAFAYDDNSWYSLCAVPADTEESMP